MIEIFNKIYFGGISRYPLTTQTIKQIEIHRESRIFCITIKQMGINLRIVQCRHNNCLPLIVFFKLKYTCGGKAVADHEN